MVQVSLEKRVANLEQALNGILSKAKDNEANIDYIAMMTDVEIEPETEVDDYE